MTIPIKQPPPIIFRDITLESLLAMRTPEGKSRNQVAKEALARYFKIMAYEAGTLPIAAREWVALKIATAEGVFQVDTPPMLGMRVYDSFQAGKLSDEWSDARVLAFMDKLKDLRPAQQWAVVDMLECWRTMGDAPPAAE